GKGHELERLKNMAMELGLSNVIFKGYLAGEELNVEYRDCIATILPCNWFEVFGRTLLESFLRGKPVIASNIAAIPEIVEHNINGFLFEPKNVEQLSQAMNILINEPQKSVEMGRNGRQKVEKYYNSELFYEKYFELLINLIFKN
ncbi:MAG: glycosyltransferase, partial [Candidatus Gastranaerophilales bacterium]|nr:glycosyltransferase [Candidatus Gastranaerophilales bacterium]